MLFWICLGFLLNLLCSAVLRSFLKNTFYTFKKIHFRWVFSGNTIGFDFWFDLVQPPHWVWSKQKYCMCNNQRGITICCFVYPRYGQISLESQYTMQPFHKVQRCVIEQTERKWSESAFQWCETRDTRKSVTTIYAHITWNFGFTLVGFRYVFYTSQRRTPMSIPAGVAVIVSNSRHTKPKCVCRQ